MGRRTYGVTQLNYPSEPTTSSIGDGIYGELYLALHKHSGRAWKG